MKTIVDLTALHRAVSTIERGMPNTQLDAHTGVGAKIVGTARMVHRYRNHTGKLTSSIRYAANKKNVEISFDRSIADYGPYVHDGTSRMAPDPFIDEAILRTQKDQQLIIEQALSKLIKQAGF